MVEIVGVAFLVSVDEGEIERPLQSRQSRDRRTDKDLDPVAPPGPRARVAVLAIVLPLAILYPLTGLSLIAAVALDRLVARLRRPASVASA